MTKTAETHHDVHELIKKRWSARSFSDNAISLETLNTLIKAASWSASSMNEQPWKYIYAHRGTEAFDRMAACLMEGNKVWAKEGAVLLLSLAKKHFERNGNVNHHHMHDTGAANTTLLLQAAHHDIFGHMMGGFHLQETLQEFNINPEEWESACFIVLGYLDDPSRLEEPFKSRETAKRIRKPIDAIAVEHKH